MYAEACCQRNVLAAGGTVLTTLRCWRERAPFHTTWRGGEPGRLPPPRPRPRLSAGKGLAQGPAPGVAVGGGGGGVKAKAGAWVGIPSAWPCGDSLAHPPRPEGLFMCIVHYRHGDITEVGCES